MKAAHLGAPLTFCVVAGPAAAHSPLPGIDGFYSGLFHPLSSPAQGLSILAIALLLSSFPMQRLPRALVAFAVGLIAGLILGQPHLDPAPWLFGTAALAATIAALAPGRALHAATALGLATGALLGWASLPEAGPMRDRLFTMSGSVTGAALGTLYLTGALEMLRDRIQAPWCAIALRAVGAWIFAIVLLMLALDIAPSV